TRGAERNAKALPPGIPEPGRRRGDVQAPATGTGAPDRGPATQAHREAASRPRPEAERKRPSQRRTSQARLRPTARRKASKASDPAEAPKRARHEAAGR